MYGGVIVPFSMNFTFAVLVLNYNGSHYRVCTGTVFTDFLVLTAAHCVYSSDGYLYPSRITLRVILKDGKGYTDYQVAKVYIHPYYELKKHNDIAIIRTKTTIVSQKVDLYFKKYLPKNILDTKCTIAGYGVYFTGVINYTYAVSLYKIDRMKPIDFYTCVFILYFFDTRVICLPTLDGRGPCLGDSGSSIICNGYVVGVLSRGYFIGEDCTEQRKGIFIYESIFRHRVWLAAVMNDTNATLYSNQLRNDSCKNSYPVKYFIFIIIILNKFILF
ncbi:hypothetical protein O3M35_006848 [Rhynocoris fuscipes]|uniref:Peptidase S1 domain-containing protein n=1 Tax=Rhynocoris fuscipes TaxID=488301 RepID=A0AAW1DM59_9HEMI